jgi:hypothetical protein
MQQQKHRDFVLNDDICKITMFSFKLANKIKLLSASIALLIFLNSCGLYKPVDARKEPRQGIDKARKNVKEGRGISLGNLGKGRGTTYEFSSSNPMWRASLELLDFLPLATVDYSGGIIITDWYSSGNKENESIKITIRFLSTEIGAANLKIIVHQKRCTQINNCAVVELKSKIKEELTQNILVKATQIQKENKNKKK